jgi:hypothetical protein
MGARDCGRYAFALAALLGWPAGRALAAEPSDATAGESAAEPAAPATGALTASEAAAKAEQFDRLAEAQRGAGVTYKNTVVRLADADANYYAGQAAVLGTPPLSPQAEKYLQYADRQRRLGAVAYKQWLVRWNESMAARAESQARPQPPEPEKSGVYETSPPYKPWLEY